MLTVKIFGTQQIQNHLHNKIKPVKLEHALDLAGNIVLRDSKILCPVDTGRLRASIDMQRCTRFCRSIGTSVEYAPYQEFGTRRMQPQPFLRPALQKNKHNITQILKEGMK